ncbi:hypothetical protein THAOC_17284, partial [Thalassiosira oceanica]
MSANIQTIANTHASLIAAKGEVTTAQQAYDAAQAETIAKQTVNALLMRLQPLLTPIKHRAAAVLQTALSLLEQLAKDSGKIQTPTDDQFGALSVPMDSAFITLLGLEGTKLHSARTIHHLVVYLAEKRDEVKARKAMFEDLDIPWDDKQRLSVGYGTADQANAGYIATQYVSNTESIRNHLPAALYRFDLGSYSRFQLPGDPTEPDPKQAFVGGISTGPTDDLILSKLVKKICGELLYATVEAKYDKLDKFQQYGQDLYDKEVSTGNFIGKGEKPADGALNAFTGGGDDDNYRNLCRCAGRADRARQGISNYDTNKTHLDEAPFGCADDDNGPGSEPPPHDRKRYVSTFMLSRRRPPAAVGSRASLLQGLLSTSTT